jgi:polygalacturonase
MQFRNSSNIRLANVTLQHSAFWTTHFYGCRDIAVTGCKILAGITVGETDGVDVDSTVGAYIAHNHIEVGDDGVALKSGMGACGRAFGEPTANVTIEHNFFNFSGGVAIGSEMSGGVRDVLIQHNVLRGDSHNQKDLWTWGPRVLTIKSTRGRGGVVENIMVYNTTCIDCDQIARVTMGGGGLMMNAAATPVVRNVTVQLVRGTTEELGFFQVSMAMLSFST